MSHSTDVYLACHCDQCHGAEAIVTARKMKFIARLASPAHEQAVHDAVTASLKAHNVSATEEAARSPAPTQPGQEGRHGLNSAALTGRTTADAAAEPNAGGARECQDRDKTAPARARFQRAQIAALHARIQAAKELLT